VAIVDPALTLTLSPIQTKYTGFDAFSHAVETFISRRATPLTELFSSQAVVGIVRSLPQALETPDGLDARTQLSFHSMLMGYNLANSSTCLPHRLQYPIGARTETAHGLGLAALFPAWVATTRDTSPMRFGTVTRWIGEGLGRPYEDIEEALAAFMDRIALQPDLDDLGVRREDLSQLATETRGSLDNDPWWNESYDLTVILKRALGKGNT
jgi:alcohol dehydrogenase class IV